MLAAGTLPFVSVHWEELSLVQRMTLVVGAMGGSHLAAVFCFERFRSMAVTLHSVGTAALGAEPFRPC